MSEKAREALEEAKEINERSTHPVDFCIKAISLLLVDVENLQRDFKEHTSGRLHFVDRPDVQDECARATAFIDAVRALIRSSVVYSVEESKVGAKELQALSNAFFNYKREVP